MENKRHLCGGNTLIVPDEFPCSRDHKKILISCYNFSKHARCMVFSESYFSLLDSLPYFCVHKDVLSAELTVHRATCASTVRAAWKQVHGRNTERLLQL